jgi:hypothetical protein
VAQTTSDLMVDGNESFLDLNPTIAAENLLFPIEPAPTAPPHPPLAASASLFTHPEGLFSLYPPSGWAERILDNSVIFTSPNGSELLEVNVTFTGAMLNEVEFDRFVNARESNRFNSLFPEEQLFYEVNKTYDLVGGRANVVKRLQIDGLNQVVTSSYRRGDRAVYSLDYFFEDNHPDIPVEQYNHLLDGVEVWGSSSNALGIYQNQFRFCASEHDLQLDIPEAWTHESQVREYSSLEIFTSPDQHAVLQAIVYDDGKEINKSVAGKFALVLLGNYFTQDLWVTEDRLLPDGAEKLSWNSPEGGFQGTMQIYTLDTTLLIIASVVDDEYQSDYWEVFQIAFGSISFPSNCQEN